MRSSEIRNTFTEFFRARDHRVWPSASLIPQDPTLLLTVAGMVPFKPYFLGEAVPHHPRATGIQKCARTSDIENVGVTTRHLTFFEMLGNFSFGDYFKRDAIRWAWELSTQGFGFEADRLWATVYEDDDEAAELWLSETDLPASRLQRRGKEDNYWDMGVAGPAGPCSEIFYDRGSEHGPDGGPVVDESRFMEFWNLVFMQYERDAEGAILGPLPKQNVDTGLGMERLAMLLQDVPNVFETDVIRPMIDRAVDLTGVTYGASDKTDISLKVIAEHARSASILISDGVLPSNEARGYILRRLLRRAVRHVRLLGTDTATTPVMEPMVETVIDTLGDAWPDLHTQAQLITRIAAAEEEGFSRTLRTGMGLLTEAISSTSNAGGTMLSGDTAFTLHDTFGFPIDLTLEIAAEQGLGLDRDAFATAMAAQRARARAARRGGVREDIGVDVYRSAAAKTGATEFVGYTDTSAEAQIGAILAGGGPLDVAEEGDEVAIVLPRTPFYAEGGGQLGDHGLITTPTGRLRVVDTISPLQDLTVHRAVVEAGEVTDGQDALAEIDEDRRASIARGHTATHILHATLKELLGDHAAQAGSAIDAGRFRFDFPHFEAVHNDQIAELEERVNRRIAADPAVATEVMSQEQARDTGATALFGEKYGEHVRVVRIGDFSLELCGGTHVGHTGEVGVFTVLSEGSIAANLRRIEAVTGAEAFTHLSAERMIAQQVAGMLKVSTHDVPERVAALLERVKHAEKDAARARQEAALGAAAGLVDQAEHVNGVRVLAAGIDGVERDGLKALAQDLRNQMGEAIVVLGTATNDGAASMVAALSQNLVSKGVTARDVLQPGARLVGGGAGGKSDVAQAGGRDGAKLPDALEACRRTARELIATLVA